MVASSLATVPVGRGPYGGKALRRDGFLRSDWPLLPTPVLSLSAGMDHSEDTGVGEGESMVEGKGAWARGFLEDPECRESLGSPPPLRFEELVAVAAG
jgi:hypothetical protein